MTKIYGKRWGEGGCKEVSTAILDSSHCFLAVGTGGIGGGCVVPGAIQCICDTEVTS